MAHSDSATSTGKSHRINQDYARSAANHMPFVLVSDGCSSSADTDFGARLLVKSAENLVRVSFGTEWHIQAIQNARKAAGMLSLETNSLDATLLSLVFEEETEGSNEYNSIKASLFGDGVVATRYKDGSLAILSVNFISGYPQYLSYELDNQRLEALHKEIGGENKRLVEMTYFKPDGSKGELPAGTKTPDTLKEAFTTTDIPLARGEAAEVECVAVFTDGVQSFMRKNEKGLLESVEYLDVVRRMMNIKLYKGEFMQRQMNGFVKEFTKNGWYNVDDFTVGAIYVGD